MANKFIIGIDLGGTNLKIALLDSRYGINHKEILGTQRFTKKEDLISGIAYAINKVIKDGALSKKDVLGAGLGLPGPVDERSGIVHFFPNIPGWKEVKLKNILEKKIGLPVFIDNDAKLMCLAEHKLGAAKGFKNALCLTLGTGIGAGIIIEGKLYRGADNAAGEMGHMPLNEKGPLCNCGSTACLEAYIGNNRILNHAHKLFGRNISLEELSTLAKKQNAKALGIWQEVGKRLGTTLAGIVNLLNLDAIVIGGGVACAGNVLFSSIKQTLMKRSMTVQAKNVKVFGAKLGNNAGLIGAAILVREGTGS